MKKFIFLMIFLFENASANTIEYYLHNPHLHATETKFNTTKGTWTTQFEYGTLSGVVSCLTNNYQTDEFQKYEQPLYDHNILVSGNEKNGSYCWCQMQQPYESKWVFAEKYLFPNECFNDCALNCSYLMANTITFRKNILKTDKIPTEIQPDEKISVISTCLNSNYENGYNETQKDLSNAIGDETNGKYCWCKMTQPIEALFWVYNKEYKNASECSFKCKNDCNAYANPDDKNHYSTAPQKFNQQFRNKLLGQNQ